MYGIWLLKTGDWFRMFGDIIAFETEHLATKRAIYQQGAEGEFEIRPFLFPYLTKTINREPDDEATS